MRKWQVYQASLDILADAAETTSQFSSAPEKGTAWRRLTNSGLLSGLKPDRGYPLAAGVCPEPEPAKPKK